MKQLPGGLRLMVYDKTDRRRTMKQIRASLPDTIDKIIDAVDDLLPGDFTSIDLTVPYGLSHSWVLGGRLYRWLRWIDISHGVSSWAEALEWLATVKKDQPIARISFWGHGSPGKAFVDREAMQATSLEAGDHVKAWAAVKERLTSDSQMWFRTCSTFGAAAGIEFAKRWSEGLGCTVAAHRCNIGPLQSLGEAVRPGDSIMWDPTEGVAEGTADRPLRMKGSSLDKPNTIHMLTGYVPEEWSQNT